MAITLARLRELLHYDPETGVFTWKKRTSWRAPEGSIAGSVNAHGRRAIMVDQRLYQAHRLAWLYVYGVWPENEIDHINCDSLDNRLCNLRGATSSENKHNQRLHPRNATGFKGVYFNKKKGKFGAQITAYGKHHWLGLFETPEDAYAAWLVAANKLHGDFARAA